MKLHKLGATQNICLDSLSHGYASIRDHKKSHSFVSARIAKDNLLVKLEWRIVLRQGDDFHRVGCFFPDVCPHWQCLKDYHNLLKRVRCQMSHGPGRFCVQCAGMKQSQFCSTEFVVAYLESNWSPRGQAVYITAWKNFGPCDTPFDTRWRSQILSIHSSLPIPGSPPSFAPGSIRAAFENAGGSMIRIDGLSSRWPLDTDVEFSRLVALGNRGVDHSHLIQC